MESEKPKRCVDCRHYCYVMGGVEYCMHKDVRQLHTVRPLSTDYMRNTDPRCGIYGYLWEPRPEPKPKRNWWRWW